MELIRERGGGVGAAGGGRGGGVGAALPGGSGYATLSEYFTRAEVGHVRMHLR